MELRMAEVNKEDPPRGCTACGSTRVDRKLNPYSVRMLDCTCRACGHSFQELFVNRDEIQFIEGRKEE